ncbi:hypothetical protein OU426_04815 [Frigidibacter sp. RF13]|uniref:hypothetical protein n=1 Tax=Frigidibacter sp. RF13 TaxID=2997340 RepID=UPI002271EBD6|nr:hypothetical protein [Frigidibacter sp. RF13]MCY1126168.1 hypothetical protein [Frigidibacter sp. RF13]
MSISVQQMADRVAELMEARLRVKGEGLAAKLRRGGRHLPRKVLAAAEALARQAEMATIPRLQMQVDPEEAAEAYDACVRYLKPLGAGARRRALLWQMTTAIATGLFVTLVALAATLAWRGFL